MIAKELAYCWVLMIGGDCYPDQVITSQLPGASPSQTGDALIKVTDRRVGPVIEPQFEQDSGE